MVLTFVSAAAVVCGGVYRDRFMALFDHSVRVYRTFPGPSLVVILTTAALSTPIGVWLIRNTERTTKVALAYVVLFGLLILMWMSLVLLVVAYHDSMHV